MLSRFWYRAALMAAASLMVAGCRSVPPHDGTSAKPALSNSERAKDETAQQLAKAHAHFGAGVVHEMNGEMDAALEEYYQAAINDPTNEIVVLDVSRRLIQSKRLDKAADLLVRGTTLTGAYGDLFYLLRFVYFQLRQTDLDLAASRTS